MKGPAPGAKRYFFIPSTDGRRWDLAEGVHRRGTWEVTYPGQKTKDAFDDLPPEGADWVEMVPPGREPRDPWPPLRLAPIDPARPRPKAKPTIVVDAEPERAPPKTKAVPKKAIPRMSKELGELLLKEQKAQKAPEGMVKCPLCGVAIAPTRNKKVRTHDDPLKGSRCEASNLPWAGFKDRPPRPQRK